MDYNIYLHIQNVVASVFQAKTKLELHDTPIIDSCIC